jgi:hypothetical protein
MAPSNSPLALLQPYLIQHDRNGPGIARGGLIDELLGNRLSFGNLFPSAVLVDRNTAPEFLLEGCRKVPRPFRPPVRITRLARPEASIQPDPSDLSQPC